MKVVIVRNGALDEDDCGVVARRQVPLLRELMQQDVELTLVLFGDPGGVRHEFERAGVDVRLLHPALPPSPKSVSRIPVAAMRLRSLLHKLDFDLLEGGDVMPAIATGLAAIPRPRKAPFVYRRHHVGGRPRVRRASRVAARLADRTLVSCEAMRRHASEVDHVAPERIDVVATGVAEPAPVSDRDLASARATLGIHNGARIITVVSQLRAQKGVDVLIRSLDHLRGRDVHLVVAGSGPDEARLRDLASRSPVPIHFLGHRNDVAVWYALADVVVMPSREEAFGRVTLESMASGKPLVATRVGGLVEAVVEGDTALLVPSDDPRALASAVATLLDDPVAASRIGRAARKRYEERFTIEHMATEWREAWQRIIASRRASHA